MGIKKYFTLRVIILLIFIILMLFAISPNPFAKGLQIKSVKGLAAENGLEKGMIVNSINDKLISSLEDFNEVMKSFEIKPVYINVETDKDKYNYQATNNIGFDVDENLTVINSNNEIEKGSKIISINNKEIKNLEEFDNIINEIFPYSKIKINTNKGDFAFLSRGKPEIELEKAKKSNLKLGMDLAGGIRVLIEPKSDEKITDKEINDLVAVLDNRLNVYGLSDLKIRSAKDWAGNKYILVEIAGVTKEDVKELIGKQGKFEAKIGNDTVFEGGKKDITFVCRGDGSCSGIRPPCSQVADNKWYCKFEFAIHLSGEAAKRHADITRNIPVNSTGEGRDYLAKTLDLYLDDKEVDSLQISSDLKGQEATAIAISGPGFGINQQEAVNDALKNMDKLQTILITGSLPLKIEIIKMDTVSPILGSEFIKSVVFAGLFAFIGVCAFIFVRYRRIKIILPMLMISACEIFLTLGFAALIRWNLDVASIAGIIAAIGTGIDDQIVITDELLKGESGERYFNWKQKMKNAFFIVITGYVVEIAAMVPLWNAGAGLLKGFAVTTIIGVSIGALITRPAFAHIIEKILE